MKIVVTDQDGKLHELDAIDGWRVMEIIRDHGLPIKAECGGCCSCATCHVYVDEAWTALTGEAAGDEADMLEFAVDPQAGSRLACQIRLTSALDGLVVRIPLSQH